jgi:hypothetical protein
MNEHKKMKNCVLGLDGLKKYQNTKGISGEKETLGGRVQHG